MDWFFDKIGSTLLGIAVATAVAAVVNMTRTCKLKEALTKALENPGAHWSSKGFGIVIRNTTCVAIVIREVILMGEDGTRFLNPVLRLPDLIGQKFNPATKPYAVQETEYAHFTIATHHPLFALAQLCLDLCMSRTRLANGQLIP